MFVCLRVSCLNRRKIESQLINFDHQLQFLLYFIASFWPDFFCCCCPNLRWKTRTYLFNMRVIFQILSSIIFFNRIPLSDRSSWRIWLISKREKTGGKKYEPNCWFLDFLIWTVLTLALFVQTYRGNCWHVDRVFLFLLLFLYKTHKVFPTCLCVCVGRAIRSDEKKKKATRSRHS